jgi:signal transduction histidine kinase/CheY-like chemotaxis protein/HPt (histidine-containing phosphotransfer) domain-containing protein
MARHGSGAAAWPRLLALFGTFLALLASLAPFADVVLPVPHLGLAGAAIALIGVLTWRPGTALVEIAAPSPEPTGNVAELRAEIEKHKQMERELTGAKQTAEAAMMSKGEFLATMSHEIRTPLNGIIPLLDLLLSSPMPPDQREHVQTAFGSAKQLLRIVDDILDYSKLEANKLELESVGLNLKDMLEGVLRLMEKPAESKGLKLSLNIDGGVRLAVRGDPTRLRQILTNLLSNAIKFTEKGTVSISVTKRGETRTQHELRFEVRDTGVGLTAVAAAKLFQPFSQAESSTTRTYGGTGLGLVICKRIVDLMGGTIGVDSTPGKGSLFWFQIPMLKALGDIGLKKRDINGARVLLVSSNSAQQRRFAHALPTWGAMAVLATNTQEAIAKLRAAAGRASSWSFDVMLVDATSIPSTVQALHRGVMREPSLEDLRLVYLRGPDEDVPAEIADNERVRVLMRDTADSELRTQLTRLLESEPKPPPAPVIVPEPPMAPSSIPPGTPIRGHVLLVEDNPVNRQVAQRLLQLAGLSLDSAENGKEAVDRLDAGHYDAVLMDCQMPVMDGYTATRTIRNTEAERKLPRIPIIAMTANAMVGDREKCLASGMDDYLSKPLNRSLLEDTLRRWLPAGAVSKPGAAPAVAPVPVAPPVAEGPRSAEDLINAIPSGGMRHAAPRMPAPPPLALPAEASAPLTVSANPDIARPPRPTVREVMQPAAAAPRPAAPGPLTAPAIRPAAAAPPVAPAATAAPAPRAPMPAARPGAGAPTRLPANAAEPVMRTSAPGMQASAAPVLSREIVDDLREIMGEEFVALVRVFLEDAPQALKKLEQAALKQDVDGLIGPAHSLKSTSANLGALALSDLARTIEHGSRQRTLTDPVGHVAALSREFHRVEGALKGFLG